MVFGRFPQHCPGGKIASVIEGHEDEDESFQKTLIFSATIRLADFM
jgi:hypothetical protein